MNIVEQPGPSASLESAGGLAVVVPYFAGHRYFPELLRSLEQSSRSPALIVVVDNGPRSERFLDRVSFSEPPGVSIVLVDAPTGPGFGRACNLGVHVAWQQGARDVVLLNQDAWVDAEMLKLMHDVLSTGQADLVGPSQYSPSSGDLSPLFAKLYFPDALDANGRLLPREERPRGTREVAELAGACILAPAQLARDIGPFDPIYTMYGEDVDLGRRARALGLRAVHVPDARLYHHHTNETGRAQADVRRKLRAWSEESRAIKALRAPGPAYRVVARYLAARLRAYGAGLLREGPGVLGYLVASDRRLAERSAMLRGARAGESAPARAARQVNEDLAASRVVDLCGEGQS